MPYVLNPLMKGEKVFGAGGSFIVFDEHGIAEVSEDQAAHYQNIPGYNISDKHPRELAKAPAPPRPAPPKPAANNQPEPEKQPDAPAEELRVGGKTVAELEKMTKAELYDLANELEVAIENPRATNAEIIKALVASVTPNA